MPRALTPGQQVETAVQLVCGVLSLLSVVTCFTWRRWSSHIRVSWAISVTLTAGLSAMVWGPPDVKVGLAVAAVTLMIALGVLRMLRAGLAL